MASDLLKKAFQARRNAKSNITRVETFLKANSGILLHKYEYETRLELLEDSFKKFNESQDSIEELETDQQKIGIRSEYEDKYIDLKVEIKIKIDMYNAENSNTPITQANNATNIEAVQTSSNVSVKTEVMSKMPEIVIEKFTGSHQSNWCSFFDIFKALVLDNTDLADIQKMIYLKSNLHGEPLKLIENLPLIAGNLPVAIKILKDRYENKLANIYAHIKGLIEVPSINKNNATNLRDFVVTIKQHTECLKNLSVPVVEWDLILVYMLSQKLDINTRRGYELERGPTRLPTLVDFLDFVERRCQAAENLVSPEPIRKNAHFANSSDRLSLKSNCCSYCKMTNHKILKCFKFKELSVSQRKQFIFSNHLCLKCFSTHHVSKCDWKNCPICDEAHNSLLHQNKNFSSNNSSNNSFERNKNLQQNANNINKNKSQSNNNSNFPNQSPQNNDNKNAQSSQASGSSDLQTSSFFVNQKCHILLATASVGVLNNNGALVPARAVLDSGSQVSLITQRLTKKLQYPTYNKNISIYGVSGQINVNESIDIKIVSTVDSSKSFEVTCSVTNFISTKLPQFPLVANRLHIPCSIVLADPAYDVPDHVDILLGADIYYSLLLPGLINLGDNLPVLQNTYLGFVVGGTCSPSVVSNFIINIPESNNNFLNSLFINSQQLDTTLQKFWAIEDVPKEPILSNDDELSENIFRETTKILENGRFQVNFPLKSSLETSKLGESFSFAKKRFLSLEKRLHQDDSLFREYSNFIEEYVRLGHARYIPLELKNRNNDHKYFIPHHCVIRNDKSTTRLRVVFDASLKTTSGYSLNSICLKGLVVQPELFDILCRFRTFRFAVVADIEKMYRQILTNPDQNYLQNILWRQNTSEDIKCIELLTISYGTNFAPYMATRCLLELANMYEKEFPLAAKALKTQTYVDDVLCSCSSLNELIQLRNELIKLLHIGKFSLHKWCSNSTEFMQKLPSNNEFEKYFVTSEGSSNKVLGVFWDPSLDCFSISLPKNINVNPLTKRNVLAVIAQIYDVLGLVGPIVVRAKIFMQKLWLDKLNWDDCLSPELQFEWINFAKNILELSSLKISRCLISSLQIKRIEVHSYSDASLKAYGCCIYLRVIYLDDTVSCNLICAKSRIAPLRTVSLPRLELSACVLSAHTTSKILKIFENSFKIDTVNFWTDSQISLAWIQSHPSKWNIFVSNRVSTIQELTDNHTWRYIPTKENPSDLVSRGMTAQELINSHMWWHGPKHLKDIYFDFDSILPKEKILDNLEKIPEQRKTVLHTCSDKISEKYLLNIFNNFSDILKLQRTIAYCLRFSFNFRNPKDKLIGPLQVIELQKAMLIILIVLQKDYFFAEIDCIQNKKVLRNKAINSLNPFIDSNGLIRVGGRLSNADLPFSQRHPILLPAKCHVVNIMLRREHLRLYHAGSQTVLNNFRLRYWPLNGLRAVKRILHNCLPCHKFKAKCAEQIMADLPKDRVSTCRQFLRVGVDFGGPFLLKTSNLRKAPKVKAYIAIFVCMNTKCVHIELVSGLSTEQFLLTLQRFIGRRGNPSVIYSDNATNFLGSSNHLKDLYQFFKSKSNNEAIENFLSKNEIQWKFIPPRSPHWGGLWEAAIKGAKRHILRTLGDAVLNFEEFTTVLVCIESIMNSRPLSALSNDPTDLCPLTPGHFLIGDNLSSYPEKDFTSVSENRLSLYQKCIKFKQTFWRRWSLEYLNRLQQRPKWTNPRRNLEVDQLVLLKEDNLPPLKWALARILELTPGKDKKVRLVKVRTQDGIFLRSIAKICPLPDENL